MPDPSSPAAPQGIPSCCFFLISSSDCLLLKCAEIKDFCVLNLFMTSNIFCGFVRIFRIKIMSSANREDFTSSFQPGPPSPPFSCPPAQARPSRMMNEVTSGQPQHSSSQWEAFHQGVYSATSLSQRPFVRLRERSPSVLSFLSTFYHQRVMDFVQCILYINLG